MSNESSPIAERQSPVDTDSRTTNFEMDQEALRRDVVSQRLRSLKSPNADPEHRNGVTSRRWIWIAIAGGLTSLVLVQLFVLLVWRLHGPQFTIGPDGWVHMRDREAGFEIDLPSWSIKNQYRPSHATYRSRFQRGPGAFAEVYVNVQPFQPTGNFTSALKLKSAVDQHRQGKVTILADRSADRTSPLIDFVVTAASSESRYITRRRLVIHNNTQLEIMFPGADIVPEADQTRVVESLRWTR